MAGIKEYAMCAVATIVFTNDSCNPPELKVWVCRDKEAMDKALVRLKTMSHITIVQSGASHIEG
jgi:hypothetical protein